MASHDLLFERTDREARPAFQLRPPWKIPELTWFYHIIRAAKYSRHTIRSYQTVLLDLLRHCREQGLPEDPLKLTPDNIRGWLVGLQDRSGLGRPFGNQGGKPLSAMTVHRYASTLRSFYGLCVEDKRLKKSRNPFTRVKVPPMPEGRPQTYQAHDIERILQLCPPNTWWGARDRAIILVLLYCGLRAGEVAGMQLSRLDLDAQAVTVLGKGDRQRLIGLPDPATRAIYAWLSHRDRLDPACDALFVSRQGDPITPGAINHMIAGLKKQTGVDVARSVHAMRHTFGVQAIVEGKIAMKQLQQILGHKSPASTLVYVKAADELQVADVHRDMPLYQGWGLDGRGKRGRR